MNDEELLREALEVLEDSKCKLMDPTLRGRWIAKKNRVVRHLRERVSNA